MSQKLRFCEKCRTKMMPKFYGYWPAASEDNYICPICNSKMIELDFITDDYWVIRHTSEDVNFIEAMIKLHDEDIIEYESRMNQFRANDAWYQEKYNPKPQVDNTLKCPMCGSTDISPISTGERAMSVIGFGILSKKINKSFKCNNKKCKYTW